MSENEDTKPVKACGKCGSFVKYKSGRCKPCTDAASKRWAENNKQKLKAIKAKCSKRDYIKNPEKYKDKARLRHSTKREEINEKKRIDRIENPDKYRAQENRRVVTDHRKAMIAELTQRYRIAHPLLYRDATRRYRVKNQSETHATEFFQMLEGINQISQALEKRTNDNTDPT